MSVYQSYKEALLNTGIFKNVGQGQYICQECPFCGDHKKHMYVLIKLEDDRTPVLYHCFKCNSSGVLNEQFLSYFGIEDIRIPRTKGIRKVSSDDVSDVLYQCIDTDDDVGEISQYIKYRIGVEPTFDELKAFQYIGKPLRYYNEYIDPDHHPIMNDRYWFKINNGSIAGRAKDDDTKNRWRKINVPNVQSKGVYTIKTPIDLSQTINVCICEGIFDAIGLFYNYALSNALYVACMGSDYSKGIDYSVNVGIFGKSVNVKIFKDADIQNVRINPKHQLLFKSISIYQNALSKDYGVSSDQMEIQKILY